MKGLKKGQLVFVKRVIWQNEDEEMVMTNAPVIYDHAEETTLNDHRFIKWWFRDADGSLDYVEGTEDHDNAPCTVEEVFGFIPSI